LVCLVHAALLDYPEKKVNVVQWVSLDRKAHQDAKESKDLRVSWDLEVLLVNQLKRVTPVHQDRLVNMVQMV